MQYEKRSNKDGSSYYSFVFYDAKTRKRLRLKREEIKKRFGKDILTETEARDCLKLLQAQYESEKIKIERRLAWQKEFYNFNSIMDEYEKSQKKRASNSWQNSVFYMKHYVLPFFLNEKKLNNIELWPDYYEQFRDWLEKDAKQIRNKKLISYSSKNHAIKSLNTFMDLLFKKGLIQKVTKCEAFGDHLVRKRSIDDVVTPEEMETIYGQLKADGFPIEAIFFRYLFFSGMRLSEGLAISLADLYQGELPENQLIAKKIKSHGMKYHGYIVSDSQIDEKGIRWPFKGKKEISEKFARTIPIVDKTLWNDLVDLAQQQYEVWNVNKGNKKDFLLFGGVNDATASRRLEAAFRSARLKYRSWHCLRHSRATWLIGETGDEVLARAWLGQSTAKVFERYNHLYQSLVREAKAKAAVGKEFNLKKI